MRNISKYHFSGKGVLLNSVMDIQCSTAEERANQNLMAVDVKGGTVKTFSLYRGHKLMTPKCNDYRNPCKELRFLICALYVSKLF